MIPAQIVMQLSWDSERPASSDFTLRKRKKSAGLISGKQGRLGDRLDSFRRQGGVSESSQVRNQSWNDNPSLFNLKIARDFSQCLLDESCINSFTVGLSKHHWRQEPQS
jgi:hypothetical protein